LVSFLDEKGQPGMVQRTLICPPRSQIGPITPDQRQQLMAASVVAGVYEKVVDRESAFEKLNQPPDASGDPTKKPASGGGFFANLFGGGAASANPSDTGRGGSNLPRNQPRSRGRQPDSLVETVAKSAARTVGSTLGREILRGVLGSIFGGRRR
jgi:uncharacterized protein